MTRTAGRTVMAALAAGSVLVVGVAAGCGPVGTDRQSAAKPSATASRGAATSATTPPRASATPSLAPVAAPSGPPFCGPSQYVSEISLETWANGDFRISLRPTDAGRHARDRDATVDVMWQAIARCVRPGAGFTSFGGPTGASLLDQLRCHQSLATVPALNGGSGYATGPTYDLESWRPYAGQSRWISTQCGNKLGTDPTGPHSEIYRPDGEKLQYSTSGERQ